MFVATDFDFCIGQRQWIVFLSECSAYLITDGRHSSGSTIPYRDRDSQTAHRQGRNMNSMQEQRQLLRAEQQVERLTRELRRAEGHRDTLLRLQLDCDGLHDRRKAVR